MRTAVFSTALAVALSVSVSASAQDERDRTRAYVDAISLASQSSDRPVARWDEDICVGAVGLGPRELQLLVDRISFRAQEVGLRAGHVGCRANVMVIYAPDSDALTRQIVNERRDLLGLHDEAAITAGRAHFEAFANTPRAVRWWHISSGGSGVITNRPGAEFARQSSGRSVAAAAASGGGGGATSGAATGQDVQGMDAVRVDATRTRTSVERNDLSYALIVVDARRVANVQLSAWIDYVAFVALAQVDADAQTHDYDTILNLFRTEQSTQTGLSDWDEAYLQALYRSRRDAAGNRLAADIARRMAQNVP